MNTFSTLIVHGFAVLCLSLSASAADEEGFEPLFGELNAEHEEGWIVQGLENAGPEVLEDGVLALGGWNYWAVISKKTFGDFILRFDVKFEPRSNGGILIHTPPMDVYKAKNRLEVQLESGDDPRIAKPESKNGAIERLKPPDANPARPIGEWNRGEIKLVDGVLWVTINGVAVQNGVELPRFAALDGRPASGHIALQRNDIKNTVYFRDLRVKRLD